MTEPNGAKPPQPIGERRFVGSLYVEFWGQAMDNGTVIVTGQKLGHIAVEMAAPQCGAVLERIADDMRGSRIVRPS